MTIPCTEKDKIDAIHANVEKLLSIIQGNGANGLVTKEALNRQSINRLWWWVGAISLAILAGAVYIIRNGLS